MTHDVPYVETPPPLDGQWDSACWAAAPPLDVAHFHAQSSDHRPRVQAKLLHSSDALHVLLREGTVGSDAFKQAVDRELEFFEDELRIDLIRLAAADGATLHEPALVSKAITRLVFAMGATAMDLPPEKDAELIDQLSQMVRMILTGSRAIAEES